MDEFYMNDDVDNSCNDITDGDDNDNDNDLLSQEDHDHNIIYSERDDDGDDDVDYCSSSYDDRYCHNNNNNNNNNHYSLLRYYNQFVESSQQIEWQCISPMTQHIIPPPPPHHHPVVVVTSPTKEDIHSNTTVKEQMEEQRRGIQRPRSQSLFNDYMDCSENDSSSPNALLLPPLVLQAQQQPQQQQQQQQQPIHLETNRPFSDYGSIDGQRQQVQELQQQRQTTTTTSPSLYCCDEFIPNLPSTNNNHYYNNNGTSSNNVSCYQDVVTTSLPTPSTPAAMDDRHHHPNYPYQQQHDDDDDIRIIPIIMDDKLSKREMSIKEEVDHDHGSSSSSHPVGTTNPWYISVLYGAINCTIVIPVVMSFGNIIYRDDAFAPYMPVLIKLTLVSGLVHQVCFSTFSTLPFAVGSVQDAGLIFLSNMAATMASYCRNNGHDDETLLATVTVGLAVATALLGIGLVLVGKLGLAGYVQQLPTCVVAGYLAYIGWFVGYSGLGIMVGGSSITVPLLLDNLLLVLPGIFGGIFIYASVQKFLHVAVLPVCITVLLLAFYIGLVLFKSSIEQATQHGWIRNTEQAPVWYHTWDYIQLHKVAWDALPQLWLTWSGMLFVVALSSSLDVAAIELEMKRPLNYNRELGVVGISNFVSGLTGGYTGSYIFSQSIFSLRIGIKSRMAGFALAFFQLIVILVPFPILSYVPNCFYGSLLSMICIDLMVEWLWEFRTKVTVAEYLICLCTFALIHTLGVEYGILAGVAIYVIGNHIINISDMGRQQ
ncbi:cyclic nucleotide-binding protein [Nitzschia inconspicua]|uniref:Cyclic nucleotide-binding protein n=1 Tax=Nitzschia inconspicua TaxID=303405 RepID=A0A9K3PEU2_9STRA|nr:cyclic nucleotide-binding protein [Nitzschia inconspicua]KAG7337047.1 cyclic nucleotide-binding protein [Nitzschia inconspicua]KAG7344665.1 cyclic nucleotide-binding protein [Nitzschia inconspicua]